jgi:3-phenylpropionate/trans-cinnamate dioxygenase ferredoxin reductase subunit
MNNQPTYVIVGASLAGATAAQTLREQGFAGRIVLVGDETELPYERPPLSKGYLLGKDERAKIYVHEESWYAEHSVEVLLGRRVTLLDRDAHQVELDTGERVGYAKLLLATGSSPRRLRLPIRSQRLSSRRSGARWARSSPGCTCATVSTCG